MEYRHRAANLEKSMSQLWRMERKRDKNAREMKVQGLGMTPGFSGTPDTHPSSPTQHRPYSRSVVCPTPWGEHSWRGQPAPGGHPWSQGHHQHHSLPSHCVALLASPSLPCLLLIHWENLRSSVMLPLITVQRRNPPAAPSLSPHTRLLPPG